MSKSRNHIDSVKAPSQSEASLFAPSCHMRLGCGLSSLAKSLHVSCFDVGAPMDLDLESDKIRHSLSESDLFSVFGASTNGEEISNYPKYKHSQLAANSMTRLESMDCETDLVEHIKES